VVSAEAINGFWREDSEDRTFSEGDKDFARSSLASSAPIPTIFFVPAYYNEVGPIASGASLGIKALMLGVATVGIHKLVETDAIEGSYRTIIKAKTCAWVKFVDDYKKRFWRSARC